MFYLEGRNMSNKKNVSIATSTGNISEGQCIKVQAKISTDTKSNINTDTYPVYIPKNIDLDELLVNYPLKKHVPNARDYILYILSRIKLPNTLQKLNNAAIKEPYTPINSMKLQKTVQHYSILLNWLIERGVIERDNHYRKDEKSKAYRYTDDYFIDKKQEFIRKKTLVSKLKEKDIKASSIGLDSSSSCDSKTTGYCYESLWSRYNFVAHLLGLKPLKMKAGLIKYELISRLINQHREANSDKLFYYKSVINKKGFGGDVLMINEDFIDKINTMALEYPLDFPTVKKKKQRKPRIS